MAGLLLKSSTKRPLSRQCPVQCPDNVQYNVQTVQYEIKYKTVLRLILDQTFSINFSTAKMTVQYGCPVQVKETKSIRWNLNLYLIISFCFGGQRHHVEGVDQVLKVHQPEIMWCSTNRKLSNWILRKKF